MWKDRPANRGVSPFSSAANSKRDAAFRGPCEKKEREKTKASFARGFLAEVIPNPFVPFVEKGPAWRRMLLRPPVLYKRFWKIGRNRQQAGAASKCSSSSSHAGVFCLRVVLPHQKIPERRGDKWRNRKKVGEKVAKKPWPMTGSKGTCYKTISWFPGCVSKRFSTFVV